MNEAERAAFYERLNDAIERERLDWITKMNRHKYGSPVLAYLLLVAVAVILGLIGSFYVIGDGVFDKGTGF